MHAASFRSTLHEQEGLAGVLLRCTKRPVEHHVCDNDIAFRARARRPQPGGEWFQAVQARVPPFLQEVAARHS